MVWEVGSDNLEHVFTTKKKKKTKNKKQKQKYFFDPYISMAVNLIYIILKLQSIFVNKLTLGAKLTMSKNKFLLKISVISKNCLTNLIHMGKDVFFFFHELSTLIFLQFFFRNHFYLNLHHLHHFTLQNSYVILTSCIKSCILRLFW